MAFTEQQKEAVWNKGRVVPGHDRNVWRKDQCDAWIRRDRYDNRDSQFGWEVDHITPKASGGSDALSNLRPLQWENNLAKSDGRLKCVKTAEVPYTGTHRNRGV